MAIQNFYHINANIVKANNALITTGLKSPIAINQRQKIRAWIPVTVGATGGVRLQIVVPAGGTIFLATIVLHNTVTPADVIASQVASAAFTNALANAGTHWLDVQATIINGATAGDVDIQMAQNTTDALTLTILRGGTMNVEIF
jgi:hypothetical protein